MQTAAIIVGCVAAAIGYGIIHDQITARVCVEYLTIGHPPVFQTDDPTMLGLGWGIIATWWVGLILGCGLALAARAGSRPPRPVRSLARPVLQLLTVMALFALGAGITGYELANAGLVGLLEPMASQVPRDRHVLFLADLWAHTASYGVGLIGGINVMVRVWRSRIA